MRADVARAVALIRAARVPVVGALGPGRALGVRRAARRRPGGALCRVALATTGRASGGRRLEGVGRTRGARPGAALGHVAGSGRRAARRPSVARRVLADVARAVALVRTARVAVVGAGRPRRALRVRRAARARPRAHLRRIALAGGSPADDEAGQEAVRGTARARARTRLHVVADVSRRAAHRTGVPRRVLAGVARAVALVRAARVPVVGARGSRRGLGVGRAGRAGAGAVLRRVALARRRATEGATVARRMLAGVPRAVAPVRRR